MTITMDDLTAVGNVVDPGYRHVVKKIMPEAPFALEDVYLKWYALCREDQAIAVEMSQMARDHLRAEVACGRLSIRGDLGFVVHHLSGEHIHLLLVFTWRENNELWETVHYTDSRTGAPFQPVPHQGHRGVMCVWEFGAIAHEHLAWTRYLRSGRDEASKREYARSHFSGTI